ncbi:MAG: hypothetical protein Q7T61_13750 [Caulobacter sp.]|nr:hypothetical protein [Caulobacter sp.]
MLLLAALAAFALSDPSPDPEMTLSPAGIREFRIGETFESVRSATDWPLSLDTGEADRCEEYRVGDDIGLYFMVEDGRLTRVTVTDPGWFTGEGIEVGDSGDAVRAAYGDKVVRQAAPYADAPAHDLLVWTGQEVGYRFELDADGRVAAIHAGSRAIEYIEGCL